MTKNDENIIGNTIKVVGWIIFAAGLIAGFVIAVSETFLTAMLVWAVALVVGAILLALSEIINLLQLLFDKSR